MFQTPATSVASSTSRRSTRATRTSYGRGKTEPSTQRQSRKRKKKPLRPSLSKEGPVRKWVKVLRPPADNAGFQTLKWVPLEELTFEEKLTWDEEQRKSSGEMLYDGQTNGPNSAQENAGNIGNSGDDANINISDVTGGIQNHTKYDDLEDLQSENKGTESPMKKRGKFEE